MNENNNHVTQPTTPGISTTTPKEQSNVTNTPMSKTVIDNQNPTTIPNPQFASVPQGQQTNITNQTPLETPKSTAQVQPPSQQSVPNFQTTVTNPQSGTITSPSIAPTIEESIPSDNQNPSNNEVIGKKSKKTSKLPLIIILLILIFGGLFLFYNYYLMNEERIITNETKKAFAFIQEKVNKLEKNTFDYDVEKESLGLEGKLTVSSDYVSEELDLAKLSNYNITYNGFIDKTNNKLSSSIALNKNNNKVLSNDMYMQGKDILIKLNELFDKTLKTSSTEEVKNIETTKSLNYDNIRTIINKTEEITLNNIDKEKLSKKIVQKEINNKKDNYMEITYKLNVDKYCADLINGYLKDEQILKIFAEIFNQTKEEIKTTLKDAKKSLENSSQESSILDVKFYMDKISGSFKEVDIISKEKDFKGEELINKFIIYKTNNIYNFKLFENETSIGTGTYNLSQKEFTFTSNEGDTSSQIILKEMDENTFNINLNISDSTYNLAIAAKINNKISSNSQVTNTSVAINYKQNDQNINAQVNNNITITKGKKPVELSSDNYVEMESLTEEQINSIEQKAINIMESVLKDFIVDTTKVPDLNQML